MSGRRRCWTPMNSPVANEKTKSSYEGPLSAKPGVPGSGGRPRPGGAQINRVGSASGRTQVQPAFVSSFGVTPALLGAAVMANTAAPVAAKTSSVRIACFIAKPSHLPCIQKRRSVSPPTDSHTTKPGLTTSAGQVLPHSETSFLADSALRSRFRLLSTTSFYRGLPYVIAGNTCSQAEIRPFLLPYEQP